MATTSVKAVQKCCVDWGGITGFDTSPYAKKFLFRMSTFNFQFEISSSSKVVGSVHCYIDKESDHILGQKWRHLLVISKKLFS
jgi:hypothetical protein